ncbi:MAG: glycosyl transferase family 1, partial [Nitrospirota bacterium]|nr:glycosyl transferase family 1 [Nitrospirota bacterium]
MLEEVNIGRRSGFQSANIENYRWLVGDELIDEIYELAKALKGVRICQINSTAYGGGVAELLPRIIPILSALGIDCDWRLLHAPSEFSTVSKA